MKLTSLRFLPLFFCAALTAGSPTPIPGFINSPDQGRPARHASDEELGLAAGLAGVEPTQFKRIASTSRSLHLGHKGHPYFVCDALAQVGPDTSPYVVSAPYPLTQTFMLHSKPGAARIIYLDFNGRTVTGTSWNNNPSTGTGANIVIPPYDTDGNPASFSNTERTNIQDIWRRVAEDYAPFDVDVTTEDPSVGNLTRTSLTAPHWGVRCLIGGTCSLVLGTGSLAGGVAHVGAFNQLNPSGINDAPCFAFPAQLGATGSAAQTFAIGECCSHEIGHTVGLYHASVNPVPVGNRDATGEYYTGHGTGGDSWAPIMGGSYWSTVTQWCKGQYTGARHGAGTGVAGTFQDEVAVISTYLPLLPDDHGDTPATATLIPASPLTQAGVNRVGGFIGSQTDVDYFKFMAGPGLINLQGLVSAASPDLKMSLTLYDSAGVQVLTNIGTGTTMDATISKNVTSRDTYYLKVKGVGAGAPTTSYNDYGSIGRYALTGSWPAFVGPAAVPMWTNAAANISGVPFTATFDGSSSSSPGATITSYLWDFGDPKGLTVNNTSAMVAPSHTFSEPGDYKVSLTIADNKGLTSPPATITVHVTGTVAPPRLKVASMSASWHTVTNVENAATVAIQCVNLYGEPARYASVYVNVTGSLNGKAAARSDANGMVYISMPKQLKKASVSYTFTVSNITLAGFGYLGTENTVNSVTISQNP